MKCKQKCKSKMYIVGIERFSKKGKEKAYFKTWECYHCGTQELEEIKDIQHIEILKHQPQ